MQFAQLAQDFRLGYDLREDELYLGSDTEGMDDEHPDINDTSRNDKKEPIAGVTEAFKQNLKLEEVRKFLWSTSTVKCVVWYTRIQY